MPTKSARNSWIIPLQRIVAEPIRVLVAVEDNELRQRMVEHLANNGFEPTPAVDVKSAIRSLQERWHDVVVLDARMNAVADDSSWSGLALVQEIARCYRKAGLLVFGASNSLSLHFAGQELGAIAYFEPTESLELLPECVFRVWKGRPI